ncbi:helix-turn-helix domain-containing protein [Mycolicibacterium iranicum]|uniref:helix-turn-helix domain-containing protein n=1 Tax=Mycolicibacterium iranicum TaxID=912594 RepID=UPI0009EEB448|nr:helix-turn-helix domain-containing protein [Mycolicibacterium iranicum]
MSTKRAVTKSHDRDELLTINEAAELLKVHHRTIRRFITTGRLPGYHLTARTVRLRRSDVEKLLTPIPTGFRF